MSTSTGETEVEKLRNKWMDDPRGTVTHVAGVLLDAALGADSRRAPTEAQLRQKIADEIAALAPYNCELRYDGSEDPLAASWAQGIHDAYDRALGENSE